MADIAQITAYIWHLFASLPFEFKNQGLKSQQLKYSLQRLRGNFPQVELSAALWNENAPKCQKISLDMFPMSRCIQNVMETSPKIKKDWLNHEV